MCDTYKIPEKEIPNKKLGKENHFKEENPISAPT
jgi:hypothetical protein